MRIVIAAISLLVGCSHQAARIEGDISLVVGLGAIDSYSSTTGELTRLMCNEEGDFRTHVVLDSKTLATIGVLATRTDFYSLPPDLTLAPPLIDSSGNEVRLITSYCGQTSLEIQSGQSRNSVDWSCRYGPPPEQVSELYLTVVGALQPHLNALPRSSCRFR